MYLIEHEKKSIFFFFFDILPKYIHDVEQKIPIYSVFRMYYLVFTSVLLISSVQV